MFLGRQKELTYLQKYLAQNKGVLGVIYGIRQVGKTSLLKEIVIKNHGIYYVADHSGKDSNLKELSKIITKHFQDPYYLFTSYYALFEYLLQKEKQNQQKIILVIDEFSYIIQTNPDILSIFQKIKDEYLNKSCIKIILAGSHLGLMEQIGQYHNPLYHRITFKQKILPFDYYEASLFYPDLSLIDKIHFYSVFGGMPWILKCLNEKKDLWENLQNILLQPHFTENILFSFLGHSKKKVNPYEPIIKSLAGIRDCQIKDISAKTNKNSSTIVPLIENLIDMGLVDKTIFFGRNLVSSRKTKYYLKDPFFNFYYHFIKKNESDYIILKNQDFFEQYIKPYLDTFIGFVFEKICQQFIVRKYQLNENQRKHQIGCYWHNDIKTKINYDIDFIFQSDQQQLFFFECKWQKKILYKPVVFKLKKNITHIRNIKKELFMNQKKIKLGFFLKNNFSDYYPEKEIIYTLPDLYNQIDLR